MCIRDREIAGIPYSFNAIERRAMVTCSPVERSISNSLRLGLLLIDFAKEYLVNLMSNLLNIESSLKKGNNPINVFTENLSNLS